ncbi:MAG: acyl-CoA dehydrogenase family protein, partial [Planctomycetota bacterium]
LRALGATAAFYAGWYPRQLAGRLVPFGHGRLGPLARHGRFIDRAAHRLAAALFHSMVRHGPRLERRQILLGHLMDIGTDLFAMSVACAAGAPDASGGGTAEERRQLADLFCRQTRQRVEERFRALRRRHDRPVAALARRVLDGRLEWLEEGTIGIDPRS